MTSLHVRVPAGVALDRGYVAATESCWPQHLGDVGGKAVGLGALLRAGQRVPPRSSSPWLLTAIT
jgi:hypothetical protein